MSSNNDTSGILIGTPVIKGGEFRKLQRYGESEEFYVPDEIKKLEIANNNPKKQCPERHQTFYVRSFCRRMDYIKRQNSYIPDADVEITAKSYLTNNNQFRKHVFVDGTSITAPKAYLMSGSDDNGAKKQGVNTVFTPDEAKENGGFIAS